MCISTPTSAGIYSCACTGTDVHLHAHTPTSVPCTTSGWCVCVQTCVCMGYRHSMRMGETFGVRCQYSLSPPLSPTNVAGPTTPEVAQPPAALSPARTTPPSPASTSEPDSGSPGAEPSLSAGGPSTETSPRDSASGPGVTGRRPRPLKRGDGSLSCCGFRPKVPRTAFL